MLQKAKELLEKHGEIMFSDFGMSDYDKFNYLYFSDLLKKWGVGHKEFETEITLDQLEGILKN